MELIVEDLRTPEWREGRRVRRDPYGQAHGASGGPLDCDDAPGQRRNSLPGVALEREPKMILAVEARLLDPHDPSGIADLGGDAGAEPGPQRVDVLHAEQRQVTRALGRFQPRDMDDQLRQLRLRER